MPLLRQCALTGYGGGIHWWDSGAKETPRFFASDSSKACDCTLPGTCPAAHRETVDWSASIAAAISACDIPPAIKRVITSVTLEILFSMH